MIHNRQMLEKILLSQDFNVNTFSNKDLVFKTGKVPAMPQNTHNNRVDAGKLAAITRRAALTTIKVGGKQYSRFNRSETGAVRVPRTWVSRNGLKPGAKILIVGSKGIKPTKTYVRADGSVLVPAKVLRSYHATSMLVRWDYNNTLVVRAN